MKLRDLFNRETLAKAPADTLKKAACLLLFFYLLAGVIYSTVLGPVVRFSDEAIYLGISANILHGLGYSIDGVHLTAWRAPGYTYFLVLIRSLGGGFFWIRVVQFFLAGATILLISRICSEKQRPGSLLFATVFVMCYPLFFYTSGTLYPQTLSAFLFVLALAFTLITSRGWVLNMVTGLAFGALILTVPTFLFTLFVLVGTAWWLKILRWRDVGVILIAAFLTVGSWTLRNAICFHQFVPVASNSGLNLLVGNNATTTPYAAAAEPIVGDYLMYVDRNGMDEFAGDRYYRDTALAWIKGHPDDAITLYFEKVLSFFSVVNVYSPETHGEISPWKQIVMGISYVLLLALVCWRLVEVRRFPLISREKLFLMVYVLTAFTSAIFFCRIRLRLPYDYLLIAVITLHLSRRLEVWLAANQIAARATPPEEREP